MNVFTVKSLHFLYKITMNSTSLNSTSLYVATTQHIMKCDHEKPETWEELYRLLPYLRNSICCVVCNNLVVDPLTPSNSTCQHHVCRTCKGGRKRIKPACTWCKDTNDYTDNKPLRTLLQCYKYMCMFLTRSTIYKMSIDEASKIMSPIAERGVGLISMIQEGMNFKDDYNTHSNLLETASSILPCVFNSSSSINIPKQDSSSTNLNISQQNVKTLSDGTALYSVLYAGTGNKITIIRNADMPTLKNVKLMQVKKQPRLEMQLLSSPFKKPSQVSNKSVLKARRGCRCGNATMTPGKLTCCGQRCPCYVENKPCAQCTCRGCRNPHRPDGLKVRPHIPEIENLQAQLARRQSNVLPNAHYEILDDASAHQFRQHFTTQSLETISKVTPQLPKDIFMTDPDETDEDEEIEVDI